MKILISTFAVLTLAAANAAETPKGLVLHYPFAKDAPKGAVPDTSGKNNNGTRVGGRWYGAGKVNGSTQLWGNANHIHTPSNDTLNPKQGTFALWFKTDRSDAEGLPLIDKMQGNKGYSLGLSGDSKVKFSRSRIAFSINGCPPILSDYVQADGSWHHAAGTYDGKTLRLFIDGKPQKQTATLEGGITPNQRQLLIGATPLSKEAKANYFGTIDEVMIFHRALKPQQIKSMVTAIDPSAGKSRFTAKQIQGRLRQLKLLYEEGLLRKDFYDRLVDECNVPTE